METFQLADRHIIESGGLSSYPNASSDESKMEVVKAFNNELVSLYDIKPPISKAKMTAITKAAMKSVKFYKHVVHGVEKFISKCRPDYKIPGLYVIDSIVRQSRHQFGIEKDVFAPRFSKNLLQTFKNICQCPEEDKHKLVRVINLWQKHKVFPEELLKKFLVLVEASEDELPELYKDEIEALQNSSKKSPSSGKKKKRSPIKSVQENTSTPVQNSFQPFPVHSDVSKPLAYNENAKNSVDPSLIQQLQTLTTLLQQSNVPNASPVATTNAGAMSVNDQVKFDKKLLEYDYGEEEDETGGGPTAAQPAPTDSITSILTNPDILRQLHTLQVQLSVAQAQAKQQQEHQSTNIMDQQRMLQHQQMQVYNQAMMQQQYQQECNANFMNATMPGTVPFGGMPTTTVDDDLDDKPEIVMEKQGTEPLEVIDLDHIATPPSEKSHKRSYSRSRSRSSSRSRSRSHRHRSRRSCSRSRNHERSRDREKNEDRSRRALPPIKRKHLAVCSTTLWVGHLSKLVQEQDLSDTFGQFGDIVSIDLIPPRGCAFLCMNRRQDADRALHKLKNTKIHGKAITIAWAPGKGMKGREWKDYWEVEYGVSYIPWNKLTKETDYDLLEEGGMLDQETMPDWLKEFLDEKHKTESTGVSAKSSSKILYTPTGTDMDESSNEDDDVQSSQNTDMIIEPTTGVPEQMIPLPDGPQPKTDVPPPMGIPLPPGQNAVPPPSLLNPFGLPPRLLGPMSMIGGNFMPPLGVPPPVPGLLMPGQPMVNRLPPPFPGPPGLPMLNPVPGPNPSLSQIPLPDSATNVGAVTTAPTTDFKPPTFGLAPPLMFPGNMNIDMSPNTIPVGPTNSESLNNDGLNQDGKNTLFPSTFSNLRPSFGNNRNNLDKDYRNSEDADYRILGDISNAGSLNESNASESTNSANNSIDKSQRTINNTPGFSRDNRHSSEFDRDHNYRFPDRNRDFEKERERYHHDRNHRYSGRSPYREESYDSDRYKSDRDSFRRSRFERDFDRDRDGDRDYKRGRDFRGTRSRDQGPLQPCGPGSRTHGRSRERDRDRDRYRDSRREFGDSENKRRLEKRDRSRDKSNDDPHRSDKRSRWGHKVQDEKWVEQSHDGKWTDMSHSEERENKVHGDEWSDKFSNEERIGNSDEIRWDDKPTDENWNKSAAEKCEEKTSSAKELAEKCSEEQVAKVEIPSNSQLVDEIWMDKLKNENRENKLNDEKWTGETNEEKCMDISDDRIKEKPIDNNFSNQLTDQSEPDERFNFPLAVQEDTYPKTVAVVERNDEPKNETIQLDSIDENCPNKHTDSEFQTERADIECQNENTDARYQRELTDISYSSDPSYTTHENKDINMENQNVYSSIENKEERATTDDGENTETELEESSTETMKPTPALKKDPNKYDMFDDSDDLPPPIFKKQNAELTTNEPVESGNSLQSVTPPPPRIREHRPHFRMSSMNRGHFGLNPQPGSFHGLSNFQRSRFQGHRFHPPFFPSPRHFSPYGDSRPPRPFRSNNF